MKPINIFQYCPKCSKKIKSINLPAKLRSNASRRVKCTSCGLNFYLSPYLTNAVILENKKNEILLVKRKFPPKIGWWDLPGGFVENDETIEQSIHREVKEELNIEIGDLKYISSSTDHYLFKKINYPTICTIFSAVMKTEKIHPQDDISGYKFFSKNKIPYSRIAFQGLRKAIKKYINQ